MTIKKTFDVQSKWQWLVLTSSQVLAGHSQWCPMPGLVCAVTSLARRTGLAPFRAGHAGPLTVWRAKCPAPTSDIKPGLDAANYPSLGENTRNQPGRPDYLHFQKDVIGVL